MSGGGVSGSSLKASSFPAGKVSRDSGLPSPFGPQGLDIVVASTGAANLASVMAGLGRMLAGTGGGVEISESPKRIVEADFAILPGVGAMGPAMKKLVASGIDGAFRERFMSGKPSAGICLGMQMFCAGSEESGGVAGMGLVPAMVRKFAVRLPLPQLGWNRVTPPGEGPGSHMESGWAYFANSYRVSESPAGFAVSTAVYGESFVAALEARDEVGAGGPETGPALLLLCQFHPELSGPWGISLFRRWFGLESGRGDPGIGVPEVRDSAAGGTAAGSLRQEAAGGMS